MARMRVVDILSITASLIFLLGLAPATFYQSRETVRRAKCASNLKKIITGTRVYTKEHDGYYPTSAEPGEAISVSQHYKDLGILCPGYVNCLDAFTCPSSGDKMPRRVDDTYDNKPFRAIEANQVSYAYSYNGIGGRNVAWTEAALSTTRILADRHASRELDSSSNHWLDGRNVAYADGRVKWILTRARLYTNPDHPDAKYRRECWWSERGTM